MAAVAAPRVDVRTRRWLLPLLVACLTMLVTYVTAWMATPLPKLLRADFVNAYMGGEILRQGHGAQLYDLGLQGHMYSDLTAPFHYPLLAFYDTPSAALLALPFTVVGVTTAWRLFSLMQVGMLVAAAVIAGRHAPWPARTPFLIRGTAIAAGVAALSTDILLLQGQWSGLFALGVALGYRDARRGRRGWAAFWLLLPILAVKPNLGLGLAAFAIAWGGRRALAGMVAAGGVVLTASVLVGGPSIVTGFLHAGVASRSVWPLASMDGITGITGRLLGGSNTADLIGFAVCLAVAALAFPLGRRATAPGRLEPTLAGATVLTLLASPHLYPHDLAILTPAVVWFLAWSWRQVGATEPSQRTWHPGQVLAAWVGFNVVAGFDEHSASAHLVPWALLALAIGCIPAVGLLRGGRGRPSGDRPRRRAGEPLGTPTMPAV